MRMDSRYIALLGKIIRKYDVLADAVQFAPEELELLRMAKTEYDFYHAHEYREAGVEPNPSVDTIQKSGTKPTGSREKLSLKTTR